MKDRNFTGRMMGPMSRIGPMRLMSPMSPMGLILLLLIIPLLAACSGSDAVEPTPEPKTQTAISFSGTMLDEEAVTPNAQAAPATRTAQGLEEVLTNKVFQVWGYKNDAYDDGTAAYTSYQTVMPGFTVNWGANTAHTTTSNTDDWEYVGQGADQTIKYWDWSAKAYRFFGATNYGGDEPHEPHEANKTYGSHDPYETYTLSASVSADNADAAPYFSRLWFSDGNTIDYPTRQFGRPVQLEFLKPFARVRFLFTFVEGLSFDRESLKNIRFYPTPPAVGTPPTIATAGTVAVSYPLKGTSTTESWTITPGTSASDYIDAFTIDYYETPAPGDVPAGFPVDAQPTSWPNTPEHWYIVIPAPSQGSYTAEVAVGTNEIKSVVIPAEYMSWKAGYEYTYKFKITEGGELSFDIIQSGINKWTSKGADDLVFYNW